MTARYHNTENHNGHLHHHENFITQTEIQKFQVKKLQNLYVNYNRNNCPDGGGNKHAWNVGIFTLDYTEHHHRIQSSYYHSTTKGHHYHHHMALRPNSGPGLPLWGFVTITFLQGWMLVQRPTPNLEDQASVFMIPGDRVAQLHPPGTGYPF
jgi:hypothetical protein